MPTLKIQENQRDAEMVSFEFKFVHTKACYTILQTMAGLTVHICLFQHFQGELDKSWETKRSTCLRLRKASRETCGVHDKF